MKKYNKTVKRSKGKDLLKGVAFVSVILLLGSGVAYFTGLNEEGDILKVNNTLGKQLDDAGWMLYTMEGCGWCDEQKNVLGNNKFDIKIEHCETGEECVENALLINTTGYPSWHNVFSNETRPGFHTIEELEEMAR